MRRVGWRLRSPAWLLATKVRVATPTRIARLRARAALRAGLRAPASLGVPVALIRIPRLRAPAAFGKPSEAVVAIGVRNEHVAGRLARDEPALRLVAQHRDELGAVVGLGAQRLVRDHDRGSWQRGRYDAIEHLPPGGDAVERAIGLVAVVDRDRGPAQA